MKYLKKSLIASLCAVSVLAITSCKSNDSQEDVVEDSETSLRVLKSDNALSQDTRTSQIKAEYLIKNNGYKDNDQVNIIVKLNSGALIDTYNKYYADAYVNVSDFLSSSIATNKLTSINNEQTKTINELKANSLITTVKHKYQTVMNGFSTTTAYKNISVIESNPYVDKVILSDTYNMPKAVVSSKSSNAIQNIVDVYETGIFNSSNVSYNGEGTVVAVLDSGFQCSHSVFKNQPEKEVITVNSIGEKLTELNAYETTENLKPEDLYYSKKIPFAYDYADKDIDVNPYDSEHGTHVAGIIGGEDDVITGVATHTQLALMKVFGDTNGGAESEDIVAALEDAVVLGVDCINLSLGTSCGFSSEADNDSINNVYKAIQEAGISLLAAASNDYSSGFGGPNGNVNKVSNPDSGTIGSPSSYTNTFSVASISGVKSNYLVANNDYTFFFTECADVTGKKNEFVNELVAADSELSVNGTKTYQYVTVPGVGIDASYNGLNVKGKIALVKRGSNTFDEKVKNAKKNGAAAVIIYNNVEGDISMSITDNTHIPAISVTKEVGLKLAEKSTGTITVSTSNLAGPFISDFSSWGPTPSLELKPEITAHGGEIMSAIPGDSYEAMSGTSMATPNLCGVAVLIRQYLKEKYPDKTAKQIMNMTNSLLMSTATIALNEEGNAYTPRKQGAGLANLTNAISTNGYISVEGNDKPKLELGDDKNRTGVYDLAFSINNTSNNPITYTLDLTAITETVSSSDPEYVAEKSYVLDNSFTATVNGSAVSNNKVTVPANGKVNVVINYKLTNEDRKYIENGFPYGIYIEGFVKAVAEDGNEVSLNAPFLGFYGDWTEAPLFDRDFFEVETEAHDGSIDDEDKIKADYYATRPYGSYLNNYIIPLGTYIYDIDETQYTAIPGSEEHIAISENSGTIDGLSVIYAGCLRAAKTMTYTITDTVTGKVIYEYIDYNCSKAFGNGGNAMPYFQYLRQNSETLGLINNRKYRFNMVGTIDYGDGGLSTNVRNSFGFDFVLDNEAPIVKGAKFQKVYDKTLKKNRYYVTLTVYDNHYVQSLTPISFNDDDTFTILSQNPIPVYGNKGQDTDVKIEITDYLESREHDAIVSNAISFNIDDYALNTNVYVVELPGTSEDIWYNIDGVEYKGSTTPIMTGYVNEKIDLTQYLTSASNEDKDYFQFLKWSSNKPSVADVCNGIVMPYSTGRAVITCYDNVYGNYARITINVKAGSSKQSSRIKYAYSGTDKIKEITFDYFDTVYAHPASYGKSDIGKTGATIYTSSVSSPKMYPGEKIQLHYDVNPWYVEGSYNFKWKSSNQLVATVDENGLITALKEGTTNITLQAEGTSIIARMKIEVLNEFIVENRMLVSYKGIGGDVVIPDDKGILYIGPYAFSLFESNDESINPDDDGDANKVPYQNLTINSVFIPEGCEQIQKYAFYNCPNLKTVVLPSTIRFIKEYAFSYDTTKYETSALKTINLEDVEVVGHNAFTGCNNLESINLNTCYTIGTYAFANCTSLKSVDLSKVRNSLAYAFANCTSLTEVISNSSTKFSEGMFENTGIKNITIETTAIPARCFNNCPNLETITINGKLVSIGTNAISNNPKLTTITINGEVEYINEKACEGNDLLQTVVLPNGNVKISQYAFANCEALTTVKFQEKTYLSSLEQGMFNNTGVSTFVVNSNNPYYTTQESMLISGTKILLVAPNAELGDYTVPSDITEISDYAFSGASKINSLTINHNVKLGKGAFSSCNNLATVKLIEGLSLSDEVFMNDEKLSSVEGLDLITSIGKKAFENTTLNNLKVAPNAIVGDYAFANTLLINVEIGQNVKLGKGTFKNCNALVSVTLPNSLLDIENETFFGCENLSQINLENVSSIGSYSFYKTQITNAKLDNVLTIGESAFRNCSKLVEVTMPKVTSIGDYAFSCDNAISTAALKAPKITSIILPESLTFIGQCVFMNCNSLQSASINGALVIGSEAFKNCKQLVNVTLSANVSGIDKFAFADCISLENINLANVKVIGEGAFGGTLALGEIDLSAVEEIGDFAFASSLLDAQINAPMLKTIGKYAFQDTKITNISLPKVISLGEGVFYNVATLTSFTLSNTIEEMGDNVFLGATKLAEINYLKDGKLVESGIINDYIRIDNGSIYTSITEKKLNLNTVPAAKNIETLEVLEGTYSVGFYAGNANKNVKKIVLPDSLRVIGQYAFFGYNNLNTVEFKSINAPIFESTYDPELKLEETDPGYKLLNKYFDIFGSTLCYTNFIDLLGKKVPIKMIVPNNSKLNGYDSIIFEAYFGGLANATKSSYTAMDIYTVSYLEAMEDIMKINVVALSDDAVISIASTAYANMSTDLTKYGYTEEEVLAMSEKLKVISKELRDLKFKTASAEVKKMQAVLDSLNTVFTIDRLSELNGIAKELSKLNINERSILDLTNYNELIASYNLYCDSLTPTIEAASGASNNSFNYAGASVVALLSIIAIAGFVLKSKI